MGSEKKVKRNRKDGIKKGRFKGGKAWFLPLKTEGRLGFLQSTLLL